MDTKKDNDTLMNKPFIFESIDEQGNYVKYQGREIEQIGFYIRSIHTNFVPCECCQRRLIKEMMNSKNWNIGNKDTEPPVELCRKFEIDDDAWKQLEKRKATKEDEKRLGTDGLGEITYI